MPVRIGLGCMRLSTAADRDEAAGIAVIHAALDAGIRLLDTADSYCHDDSDRGHNERLIAEALRTWSGSRGDVRVATKGGFRRPRGRWTPDGRAAHLREACEASCRALGVDVIDLYQLHLPDPRVRFETSVRALASLRDEGRIRRIGLCNVTVGQIEAARTIVDIASVQVALSPFDTSNLRNGVVEYCCENGIELIAYRPLGGDRSDRPSRHDVLCDIAADHGATPHEIALAWLLDLDPGIVPIPGASRTATARSAAASATMELTDGDRSRLDRAFPAGRILRVPRERRRPPPAATGEVVLVMGIPAAGKSTVARDLEATGYGRLNRDERGGAVSDLIEPLSSGLAAGHDRWVLDNTYPTRAARNEVIECAWSHGTPVRCIWIDTPLPDAQINAIERLLELHGRLPMPEELAERGRTDPRWFGPDAQFRFERQLEPPVIAEGFTTVERREFGRSMKAGRAARAVIVEFDDVLFDASDGPALSADRLEPVPGRAVRLASLDGEGFRLAALAWRPQIGSGEVEEAAVRATFDRARELLGVEIEILFCPHVAGPPVCWCRKPLPGLVLDFAHRNHVRLDDSVLVGRSPADRTLATRLGLSYAPHDVFFTT